MTSAWPWAHFVNFDLRLHGRGDAKTALMRIAGQAMTALGMGGPGKFDNRYVACLPDVRLISRVYGTGC